MKKTITYAKGGFNKSSSRLRAYPNAVKQLANERPTSLVDVNRLANTMYLNSNINTVSTIDQNLSTTEVTASKENL